MEPLILGVTLILSLWTLCLSSKEIFEGDLFSNLISLGVRDLTYVVLVFSGIDWSKYSYLTIFLASFLTDCCEESLSLKELDLKLKEELLPFYSP